MLNLTSIVKDYTTVFVDLDDTIFNYTGAHNTALTSVFNKFNITQNQYDLARVKVKKRNLKTNLHKKELYFKKVCENLQRPLIESLDMFEHYTEVFNRSLMADSSMLNLLKHCDTAGKVVVAITNFYVIDQLRKLKSSGFINYIHHLITSEEFELEKPSEFLINRALKVAGNPDKSKVIMFGDSLVDDTRQFGIAYHPYNCARLMLAYNGPDDLKEIVECVFDPLEINTNNIVQASLDVINIYHNTNKSVAVKGNPNDHDTFLLTGHHAMLHDVTGDYVKLKIDVVCDDSESLADIIIRVNGQETHIQFNSNVLMSKLFTSGTNSVIIYSIKTEDLHQVFKSICLQLKRDRFK